MTKLREKQIAYLEKLIKKNAGRKRRLLLMTSSSNSVRKFRTIHLAYREYYVCQYGTSKKATFSGTTFYSSCFLEGRLRTAKNLAKRMLAYEKRSDSFRPLLKYRTNGIWKSIPKYMRQPS